MRVLLTSTRRWAQLGTLFVCIVDGGIIGILGDMTICHMAICLGHRGNTLMDHVCNKNLANQTEVCLKFAACMEKAMKPANTVRSSPGKLNKIFMDVQTHQLMEKATAEGSRRR